MRRSYRQCLIMERRSGRDIYPDAAWRPNPLEPPVYAVFAVSLVFYRKMIQFVNRAGQHDKTLSASTCVESQTIVLFFFGRSGRGSGGVHTTTTTFPSKENRLLKSRSSVCAFASAAMS